MNNSDKLLQQKIVYIIFTKLHALLILSFMIETYCCKIIKVIILLKERYIYFDGKYNVVVYIILRQLKNEFVYSIYKST